MAENINFESIDVSDTFGVSPPRNSEVSELLKFSRSLDVANTDRNMKYHKLKKIISSNIVAQTASNDEFVDTVAEVVPDRVAERISAAIAPLVEAINQLNTTITRVEHEFGKLSVGVGELSVKFGELRVDFRDAEIENRIRSDQNINGLNRCILGKPT